MREFQPDETEPMALLLKQDQILCVPTDTVYGICARMTEQAQTNLRALKHRPLSKALPLMCADIEQAETIAIISEKNRKLMETLMPGPLTVILPKREEVPDYVNGGLPTLAIRLATSESLKKLIQAAGSPLFMTSANLSGEPTCRTIAEVEEVCPGLAGVMLGAPSFGEASTIVDCSTDTWKILRQGPITQAQLDSIR